MLVKLRRRLVLVNMGLVSLVLIAVFIASTVSAYQSSRAAIHDALLLTIVRSTDGSNLPQVGGGSPLEQPDDQAGEDRSSGNTGAFTPVFSVTVDSDLTILSVNSSGVVMGESLTEQAIALAAASNQNEGKIDSLDLYYMKAVTSEGTRIAFADASAPRDALLGVIGTSLLIGTGALLAFLVASILLARIAVRPVEDAWKKQQRFVADASHELKTPLTVILANNDILLSHPDKTVAEQEKWVISTEEEAERMEGLVQNLLLLAQTEQEAIDSQKPATPHTEVNLSEIAQKSTLQYEAVAFEKGIRLENDIEEGITFFGDGEKLERLFKILLDNACKYANIEGTVQVTLKHDRDGILLQVLNTGVVIAQDDLIHIFERFYRSDKARSHETGGYGLGLAIAQNIVATHDGAIDVTSSEEEGTVFSVKL